MAASLLAIVFLFVSAAGAHGATSASAAAADSAIPRGGSTEVTLSLTGETVTTATPTDIMVVLDESGSVNATQFAQMKAFAGNLVGSLGTRGLFDNGGRVGIAMFATTSRLIVAPQGSQTTVHAALSSVTQNGGNTCIGCGLQRATQQLTADPAEGRNRITVLLTDGMNNRSSDSTRHYTADLPARVTEAEAAGIERFAIGVGNYSQADLVAMASQPTDEHVFTVTEFTELEGIVGPIVESLDQPAATNVVVTSTVAETFTPADEQADTGTVTRAGNVLTWSMGSLGAQTATLTYTVTHDGASPCALGVAVHDSIAYADDEGAEVAFPPVTVDVEGCPPVLVGVPDDITAEATSDDGAVVPYDAPTAEDAIDGSAVPVACAPASGTTFALGMTPVTCTATDAAGNAAQESFTVTVVDTTAPSIDVPDDLVVTAEGTDGAAVVYSQPTAHDAVDGVVPVSCSPTSGAVFPVGSTLVTCAASDAAGNESEASFTVTVQSIDQQLFDLLDYVTGKGPGNALRASVLAAMDAVDRGQTEAACSQLQSLANQATAQSGKQLSPEETTVIVEAAGTIRSALGC